jgi:hypothetical protein
MQLGYTTMHLAALSGEIDAVRTLANLGGSVTALTNVRTHHSTHSSKRNKYSTLHTAGRGEP